MYVLGQSRGNKNETMSEALYERIFEETGVGIAVLGVERAEFERVNEAYADSLGSDPSTLEGESLVERARDGDALLSAIERALAGDGELVDVLLTGGDGTEGQVTLELEGIEVHGERRLLSTVRNEGNRTAADTPRPSERRLEVALAGTDTGVWEWDMASDEVIWTESMEQLFGREPGTFEGTFQAFADHVHPEDLPAVQEAIETAIERDELFQTEYRIERADGGQRWVYARGELHGTSDGPGRVVGIVTDITDRKESEQALRAQQRQYKQLVERLPQAHYTLDSEFRVTFCNEALVGRLGLPAEDIEGESIWDLFPEVGGTIVEQTARRVLETGEPDSCEYRYDSGEYWVTLQIYPYDQGIAVVSTDISEQQQELASVLDATPVVIYRLDSDGLFQEAHGEMLSRLGLNPEELVGESIFELYADHDDVIEAAERALSGESFRYTVTLGDITLETNYTPVYEDGEVTEVIGVSMDVTELQRQRERMEFFNSILRHDVLNGMTVIKMRGELLAAELEGDHKQYAQTIVDWCDTTTEVTKRVRRVIETLATPNEDHRLEPIDVSAILERKVRELANAYSNIEFGADVPDGIRVRADELLADVLGNVLTNSIEHNDNEGLRIETRVETDGDWVRVEIADNGEGVADDRKESIFRRGETSHAKETGSGFGLFFVDVMVEKYGGRVRVEDSDDGGARFVIELAADSVQEDLTRRATQGTTR